MAGLQLYLLGAPRLVDDGQEVSMDTRKAIALLAFLALNNQEQSRDVLAELFWPDDDQAGARGALRRTLSTLYKAMGSRGLHITRETIGMDASAGLWVDAVHFTRLAAGCEGIRRVSPSDCPDCLDQWEEAARFYQADFMTGFALRDSPTFDEWQYLQGENLRRELARVLESLANCLAFRGEFERAIQYGRRWCGLDPLREEAYRLLMLVYARSGRRSDALRQYQDVVRILDRELSVAPLEETSALYQAILSGKVAPVDQALTASVNESAASAKKASGETSLAAAQAPLIGRSSEWSALILLYQSLLTPASPPKNGHLIAIEGEAGIGKTRLAEDFLAHVRRSGGAVLQARAYEGEASLAYGPFSEALTAALQSSPGAGSTSGSQTNSGDKTLTPSPTSNMDSHVKAKLSHLPLATLEEVSQLIPGLLSILGVRPGMVVPRSARPGGAPMIETDLRSSPTFKQGEEGPAAQTRFFEALRQVIFQILEGSPPGVLFLDDLQWADATSLDLLAYLTHRLPAAGILILTAWRSEDTPAAARLRQISVDARRDGCLLRLVLKRLNPAEISELTRSRMPANRSLPREISQHLYHESEGLPFFAVEYLQSLDPTTEHWQLPAGVRELLHQRLAATSETARQLLNSAAVIGRSFDFGILQTISGRSDLETVQGIEELLQRGILTERSPGSAAAPSYDFTHAKLRELAYDETSLARRRVLHQRTAECLAAPGRDRRELETQASLIAGHFQAAGQDERAADYFRMAGDHARRLHANAEALAHYQAALAAGHAEAAVLHEALGDLHLLQGSYLAAIASYQAAAALCAAKHIPVLMHKLGEACHRRGEYATAEGYFRSALEAAGASYDAAFQAHLYTDWSLTARQLNQPEVAQRLAETARQRAQASQDASSLAQALNMLGTLAHGRNDLAQAASYLEDSLKAANYLDNMAMRSAALNNLARVYLEQDRLEDALTLTHQALETCIRLGDRHRQAALHNLLADIYHLTGKEEEAMQQLELAVVLFSEIGEGVGRDQPEIWKLTEW